MASQFDRSLTLPNRFGLDVARALIADTAIAIGAFGLLLHTYTQETEFSVRIHSSSKSARILRLNPERYPGIGDFVGAIEDQLRLEADLISDFDLAMTLSWSEREESSSIDCSDGPGMTLVVRLPTLSLDLGKSTQRGVLEATNAMERIGAHWRRAVTELLWTPGQALTKVDLLEASERRLLLDVWSRSEVLPALATPGLLHRIFEEQVELGPDKVAVECKDQRLTYRELNAKAERLASGLRRRGIGPGSFIAFQLPRSIDVYVALLGVLKSGAAYVPLDPEYPAERVHYILSDCGVEVLL